MADQAARKQDGSAGDADYGLIGQGYTHYRQPDPHIAAQILDALGEARTVLNVGAGAGSYEPTDREVTALEPSASMRAQRPSHLPRAVDGAAEALPFADASFDASMTTFSVHQWSNLKAGLAEMRRVTRGPVLVLSADPQGLDRYWLNDYAPEVVAVEASRYPSIDALRDGLGGTVEVRSVAIPLDCKDGFNEAYYGRPERLLDPGARKACSGWSFVGPEVVARFEAALRRDLDSGAWDERHGALRGQAAYDGPLRLVIGRP
jgi:SAM-dependent methyltransferase